jgi:hypothetical protein
MTPSPVPHHDGKRNAGHQSPGTLDELDNVTRSGGQTLTTLCRRILGVEIQAIPRRMRQSGWSCQGVSDLPCRHCNHGLHVVTRRVRRVGLSQVGAVCPSCRTVWPVEAFKVKDRHLLTRMLTANRLDTPKTRVVEASSPQDRSGVTTLRRTSQGVLGVKTSLASTKDRDGSTWAGRTWLAANAPTTFISSRIAEAARSQSCARRVAVPGLLSSTTWPHRQCFVMPTEP